MRNGRSVLPVGDEGTTLNLYVTQLGNVQPPRVCFKTIPLLPIFGGNTGRPCVTILRLRETPLDLLPDLPHDTVALEIHENGKKLVDITVLFFFLRFNRAFNYESVSIFIYI